MEVLEVTRKPKSGNLKIITIDVWNYMGNESFQLQKKTLT